MGLLRVMLRGSLWNVGALCVITHLTPPVVAV